MFIFGIITKEMQVITLLYRGQSYIFLIITVFIFLVIFNLYKKSILKQWGKEGEQKRNNIIKKGEKIIIPFEDIRIVSIKGNVASGPATRSDDSDNTRFGFGHHKKFEVVEWLYIQYDYNDITFESNSIVMDRKTLEIKVYMQKEVYLYYDKLSGDYFFDLDFLER